jgi:hypothetical protein
VGDIKWLKSIKAEHLPHHPKVKGSYPAASTRRDKMAKKYQLFTRYCKLEKIELHTFGQLAAAALWQNTCLIILKLRVQILPLAPGERKGLKSACFRLKIAN